MNSKAKAVAGQSLAKSAKSLCHCHVNVGHTIENALANITFNRLPIELE